MVGGEFGTGDATDADAAQRAQRAQREADERGLLLLTCGAHGNVVRMIPPLVVDAAQIDEAVQIWSEAVAATSG
jgi:4-aminobutyrate aminotransferase